MKKSERYANILKLLNEQHDVQVKDLAKRFNVSEMTIRRDLHFLSSQYNIRRTHGGAYLPNEPIIRMVSFDENRISNKPVKLEIAKEAVNFISPGQRIFIDAGSTTRVMLEAMSHDMRNVIVTNHLKVAEQALQFPNLSVIMLGGEMIRISNCSSGIVAEEQIKRYELDIAFLGAAAVGNDGKLYDGYSPEARLKSSIFDISKKVYLLVDSSKFNTYDINEFGSLEQLTAIITDNGIDEEAKKLLEKHEVKTYLVNKP